MRSALLRILRSPVTVAALLVTLGVAAYFAWTLGAVRDAYDTWRLTRHEGGDLAGGTVYVYSDPTWDALDLGVVLAAGAFAIWLRVASPSPSRLDRAWWFVAAAFVIVHFVFLARFGDGGDLVDPGDTVGLSTAWASLGLIGALLAAAILARRRAARAGWRALAGAVRSRPGTVASMVAIAFAAVVFLDAAATAGESAAALASLDDLLPRASETSFGDGAGAYASELVRAFWPFGPAAFAALALYAVRDLGRGGGDAWWWRLALAAAAGTHAAELARRSADSLDAWIVAAWVACGAGLLSLAAAVVALVRLARPSPPASVRFRRRDAVRPLAAPQPTGARARADVGARGVDAHDRGRRAEPDERR